MMYLSKLNILSNPGKIQGKSAPRTGTRENRIHALSDSSATLIVQSGSVTKAALADM
jgi:hypothetical protein